MGTRAALTCSRGLSSWETRPSSEAGLTCGSVWSLPHPHPTPRDRHTLPPHTPPTQKGALENPSRGGPAGFVPCNIPRCVSTELYSHQPLTLFNAKCSRSPKSSFLGISLKEITLCNNSIKCVAQGYQRKRLVNNLPVQQVGMV